MPPQMYERLLSVFLQTYSEDAPAPQRFLVTGHMRTDGGHTVVAENHLRIASSAHATPREAGQYLLLDFGKPVESMDMLVASLATVF